jgi:cytochrome c-type biogenesis protein CcmH
MSLWFILALMTAAAVFAVLWPLGRRPAKRDGGSESAVYRDQLAEVERDQAAGLIGAAEAEAARAEIGRRLLAASAAEGASATTPTSRILRRAVALVALIGLPSLTIATYLSLGSPQLPDLPLAERARQQATTTASLDSLVAQVEAHLEKNPGDARGWQVLAPVLMRQGRYDEAVRAFRNLITYGGETADRRSDLGEAMAAAAGGVVTADAKTEFQRAVTLDGGDVKARYFLGLAAEQDGRTADARTAWEALLAGAPPNAPWRPLVQAALARVGGNAAPGPSAADVAAARDMPAGDRDTMIRGMVDRLAARLKQNGDDPEGWLRLVRAYMVLGETDKAKAARADARQALGQDAARLQKLNDGLKDLGLDG